MIFIRMLAIALLLIPTRSPGQTKNYKSLFDSDLVWLEESYENLDWIMWQHYWVSWGRDTMLNGKMYKSISDYEGIGINFDLFCRMDRSNSKAYIYTQRDDLSEKEDILIYDLSLEPGDSILVFGDYNSIYKVIGYVLKKDSVWMNNSYLTRLYLYSKGIRSGESYTPVPLDTALSNILWIEGIGTSTGMIFGIPNFMPFSGFKSMRCAYMNNIQVYRNTSDLTLCQDCCNQDTLLVTKLAEKMVEGCTIYPNPTKNGVTINLPVASDWNIQLRDLSGKHVLREPFNGSIFHLQLPPLANGVYLLHVKNSKTEYVKKLVIQ